MRLSKRLGLLSTIALVFAAWVGVAGEAAARQGANQGCSAFKTCGDGLKCMPFRQVCHRNSGAQEGEACQAGFGCASGFNCEAGSQVCRGPGKVGDACHATKPCGSGLSCAPGVQKCYHSPRQDGEPCLAGYVCGSGLSCAAGEQVCYRNAPTAPFSNGQHKRPFYVIGHNPNTLEELKGDLDAGANGLEPDMMKFSDKAHSPGGTSINSSKGTSGLFVYHDDVLVTTRAPLTVEKYYYEVAQHILNGRNIALLTIDVKSSVYGSGPALVNAVHGSFLRVPPAQRPWVIYNTGDNNSAAQKFFKDIAPLLNAREGMMIDGTSDPETVYTTLQGISASGNIGYGTGGQGITSGSFPKAGLSVDHATWFRTSKGYKASVPYVFPIPDSSATGGIDWWGSFMDAGVDGLIPNLDINPTMPSSTQAQIKKLKAKVVASSNYYLGTVADNPFVQGREGYALRVDTGSNGTGSAGTDGNVTFTLRGTKGSASAAFNGRTRVGSNTRFHNGGRDFLVIPSKDLGVLRSLTMYTSGAMLHSWTVKQIQITSFQYGIPFVGQPDISINQTVKTTKPVTIDLNSKHLGRP